MKNRGVVPVRKSLTDFEEPSFSGKYLHCASAGSHWLMERMALQAASPKSSTPTHFFGVLLRASILGVFGHLTLRGLLRRKKGSLRHTRFELAPSYVLYQLSCI